MIQNDKTAPRSEKKVSAKRKLTEKLITVKVSETLTLKKVGNGLWREVINKK